MLHLNFRQLTRKIVQRINMVGGSFLGVSRGCPPLEDIVSKLEVCTRFLCLHHLHALGWTKWTLLCSGRAWYLTPFCNCCIWFQEWKVNMFFVIGGNGSHAGANAIYQHVNTFHCYPCKTYQMIGPCTIRKLLCSQHPVPTSSFAVSLVAQLFKLQWQPVLLLCKAPYI